MYNLETKITKNIKYCNQKYRDESTKKISSFISLGIDNQYNLSLHAERERRDINIESLLQKMLNSNMKRISLLGGPGAGKSTMLLKMAILLTDVNYNENDFIPILIKCGLEKSDDIKNLVHISGFSEAEKERLWEEGRLFLIFDGINEVSDIEVREFLNKVTILSEEYPECRFVVSCRSLEFPAIEYTPFEKYTVLPVTNTQIENNLKMELGEEKGEKYFSELCHSSKNYLLDICKTPLLLSLVISILSDPVEIISLEQLRNKSDIYKYFYKSLTKRQRMKSTSPAKDKYFALRYEIFKTLAYYMQGKGIVYIGECELVNLIRNMKYTQSQSLDIIRDLQKEKGGDLWYWKVVDELKKSGLLNTYNELDTGNNTFAFIHQSFQEYFVGCFLSSDERIMDERYSIFLLQQGRVNNENIKMSDIKRNCSAIEFASNQDVGNRIISYIMRLAQKREDPNILELAANCIIRDATGNKHLVDDCCIWLLEAFKYWKIPYKYNLIYAANKLLTYISESFPERLKKDILYFGKKYTGGYITFEYPESFDFAFLRRIIEEENLEHKLNAIFTLGERNWPVEKAPIILEYLFSLIKYKDNVVREQVVKSIKGIIEHNPTICLTDEKLWVLVKIIENKEETGAIRTYTLNTVAATGDTRAIPILMDYLKNKENPYRDSASWSLQELVLKSSNPQYSKKYMRQFYFECLLSESDDENGMYSKGNLVYTLAKLDAVTYLERLKKWIVTENEPYVQEDGINAIGVLGGISDISFIDKYTLSPDPVIRSKALRSLLKIDGERFWNEKIEQICNDTYSIVSHIADKEKYIVTEKMEDLLEINSKNNENHQVVNQSYGNVMQVINQQGA